MFECMRCGYTTQIKGNLKNHFNRKNTCKPIKQNISIDTLRCTDIVPQKIKSIEITHPSNDVSICQPNVNILEKEQLNCQHNVNIPIKNVNPNVNILEKEQLNCQHNVNICQPNVNNSKLPYICEYCNKGFKHRQSKSRHQRGCNPGHTSTEVFNFFKNQLIQKDVEMEAMKQQMNTLIGKVGNTHIENQQINININNYGNENLDYLTPHYLQNLLKIPYVAIHKLVKDIYFNPEHPENHNIKISNKKLPYASIYKNKKWVYQDKKEIIDNIVDKGYNILDIHYSQEKTKSSEIFENFRNFQDKYDNGDKQLKKQLVKDTEITVINES